MATDHAIVFKTPKASDTALAEVRAWLSKAGKDLVAAQQELLAGPPFIEDIVFHS